MFLPKTLLSGKHKGYHRFQAEEPRSGTPIADEV